MSGIYGVLTKEKTDTKNVHQYFYSSQLDVSINEEFTYETLLYGRSVIPKFLNDRVLYEDETIIIGFEGIFFNKEDDKSFDTIKRWYVEEGICFVHKIKGQFCGFIYDKRLDKLYIYNDHLSTKPLYYYKSDELFIFASELKVITKLLSEFHIKKELDYDAVYSMLTFGYMLEDITYEKNTKKLKYATILEIDKNFKRNDTKYFHFIKQENFDLSKEEIIDAIDDLLRQSVHTCWKKDEEYGYQHYCFLSGGLDSRVNLLLAKELGYTDVLTMTFSQSNSSDQKIAQQIASCESFKHLFYSLDNGKFLEKELETYVQANDGLAILNGSASGYDFLKTISVEQFGALHTGQIGDLLFGSYIKNKFQLKSAIMSNQIALLEKISLFKGFEQKYTDNAEIFGYEQRVINGTFNGDRTASHLTDMISPFYNKELISLCLTIPDQYKKDEAIYLDWFKKKLPTVTQYTWESAGVKPKNIGYVKIAKKIKRYKNAFFRRLGFNINDMNPFDVWLRNNSLILKNLNKLFEEYIEMIVDDELRILLKDIYNTNVHYNHYGRNNKFLVVTVLLSYDLHFGDV